MTRRRLHSDGRMNILFAAPEASWGGLYARLRDEHPQHTFSATGRFAIDSLAGFDVLIPTMSEVTARLLATTDSLKLIQQVGAGLERVDISAAEKRGVRVANVPTHASGNADSVAELGIYLMIGLARDFRAMRESLANRRIGQPIGQSLQGKTVGIVGLGGLGTAIAVRLRAFGVRLIGIKRRSPHVVDPSLGLEWVGGADDLPVLLQQSDFVVLCLPDNAQTHGMMNNAAFSQMRPSAFLINLGRGGLVDRAALETALRNGSIAGAGLDVFWQEPVDPTDPIFEFNVLATPHVAGATETAAAGIFAAVCENLSRLADGTELLYLQVPSPLSD